MRPMPPVDPADAHGDADDPTDLQPRWRSEELLEGKQEVLIRHGKEIYRLRLTKQGKLILYK